MNEKNLRVVIVRDKSYEVVFETSSREPYDLIKNDNLDNSDQEENLNLCMYSYNFCEWLSYKSDVLLMVMQEKSKGRLCDTTGKQAITVRIFGRYIYVGTSGGNTGGIFNGKGAAEFSVELPPLTYRPSFTLFDFTPSTTTFPVRLRSFDVPFAVRLRSFDVPFAVRLRSFDVPFVLDRKRELTCCEGNFLPSRVRQRSFPGGSQVSDRFSARNVDGNTIRCHFWRILHRIFLSAIATVMYDGNGSRLSCSGISTGISGGIVPPDNMLECGNINDRYAGNATGIIPPGNDNITIMSLRTWVSDFCNLKSSTNMILLLSVSSNISTSHRGCAFYNVPIFYMDASFLTLFHRGQEQTELDFDEEGDDAPVGGHPQPPIPPPAPANHEYPHDDIIQWLKQLKTRLDYHIQQQQQ
ncbi:hypothetical protein IEQ34_007000 [Dendrobium chrysotoxum]|uniref:Uncharacterized protein n=1 Tax=Dendrobium chrysotoxum TaxID=161865 RepID=A0AAV7H805_DENCH|nr:hypothetical protein IEQ34_007000 [Dendrobium chrysotoxum]